MLSAERQLHTFALGNEVVCLDSSSDRLHVANGTGVEVWRAWASGRPADETIAALQTSYEVPAERLAHDVRTLYRELDRGDEFTLRPVPDYEPITDPVPDREPLATPLTLALPGLVVLCRVETAQIAHRLMRLFPLPAPNAPYSDTLTVDVYEERGRFPIVHDDTTLDTGLGIDDAVIKAMREIAGLASRRTPWIAIVHAAAAAHSGRAVLFPAIGGSGKTTLVAWLGAHGWRLLNDDAVPVMADDGKLRTVPVALSVKSGSWPVLAPHWPDLYRQPVHGDDPLRIRYLPVGAERACVHDTPCALIALPHYDPDLAVPVRVAPVSAAAVLRDLVEGGCAIERPLAPRRIAALVAWIGGRDCVRIRYRDAEAARLALESML